jgi:hypothetical protein
MNLILLLLSFLFASYAPTTQTTDDGNDSTSTTVNEPGPGRGGNTEKGDYIITNDINP